VGRLPLNGILWSLILTGASVAGSALAKQLPWVDFVNDSKINLSSLVDSYSAIVFVCAAQNSPRAAKNKNTAHHFS
jgi:hypothetical protein